MSSGKPIRLFSFIEFVSQNGSNIDFINNIYLAFFTRMFRMPADDNAVYQLITHFSGKLRYLKIFLDIPYKVIGTLYRVCRFGQPRFRFRNFGFQPFLLFGILLDTAIYRPAV